MRATRAADGRLDLQTALALIQNPPSAAEGKSKLAVAPAAETQKKAAVTEPTAAPAPWRYHIDDIAFADWELGLRDESTSPAADLGLAGLALGIKNVSEDLSKALPLNLAATVGKTGQLRMEGKLTPATAAADLKVSLTDLGLSILQPYIAQKSTAHLAGGSVSTQGTFTLPAKTGKDAPAFNYSGDFQLRDLRINEEDNKSPLLTWKRLRTAKLRATPTQLDIGELQLVGLDTQLIIYKDKTSNISRLMKVPDAPNAVSPAPTSGNANPVQETPPPTNIPSAALLV